MKKKIKDWTIKSISEAKGFRPFDFMDIKKTILTTKKNKLKICYGMFDPVYQDIILFGNSENTSEIIKAFNHEFNHYITEKILKEEFGYNDYYIKYYIDYEYGVDLLYSKRYRKIHNKMFDFIEKLWRKVNNG